MITAQQWILLVALFAPMLGMLGILRVWRWTKGYHKERTPVSEMLLRPAGESLRLKLLALDEQLNDNIMLTLFVPALVAAMLIMAKPLPTDRANFGSVFFALLAVAGFLAFQFRKLIGLIPERRNYRLGFAGERAVAEELNQLMLDGCRVFHDVPMEPYGNLDHVIVAPTGVYAVETKARWKREASPGKRDYEVTFDGKFLNFPGATEKKPIEQAQQQADRLRVLLTKAVGEPVPVRPILTFPGWFVKTSAKSEMKVLNPKSIRSAVLDSQKAGLPEQLRQRIAHQLDQKCRDVAF